VTRVGKRHLSKAAVSEERRQEPGKVAFVPMGLYGIASYKYMAIAGCQIDSNYRYLQEEFRDRVDMNIR